MAATVFVPESVSPPGVAASATVRLPLKPAGVGPGAARPAPRTGGGGGRAGGCRSGGLEEDELGGAHRDAEIRRRPQVAPKRSPRPGASELIARVRPPVVRDVV